MKVKKIIIVSLISFFFARDVLAGQLFFEAPNTEIKLNGLWEVSLWLDTAGEQINAIEGILNFPVDKLELKDIKTGNSLVNFWVEEPSLISSGQIQFSGIVPGGYSGKAQIFKVIFQTKSEGAGTLDIKDARLLLNDGLGTATDFSSQSFSFAISKEATATEVVVVDLTDTEAPETFTPIITKIPEIAGDNYILIFSTQDKGTGIDHYEIKEGYRLSVEAMSPYILKNQKLDKEIVVKAIDRAGNERKVVIAPLYPAKWYENYWIFAIIISVLIIYFFGKYQWKKSKQK